LNVALRFEELLEAAPDGMFIVDHEGRIMNASARACMLFGYESSELVGESIDVLVPERLRAAHASHRRRYHEAAQARPMGSFRDLSARRKDGTEFSVEVSLSPIAVDGGGTVVAVRDVTERKKLELRLIASDRLAALGTLAAGMAHEINNPLTYVILNLDLIFETLRRAPVTPGPAGALDLELLVLAARDGADRVRKIVAELKRAARTSDETRKLVDLHEVLDGAVRMSQNEIRYRATLVRSYGVTPRVFADEARLGQVFVNLLVNAAQAVPEGDPEGNEVRISTGTDDAGRAVVEVHDTGTGIPADALPRLFDPFFTTKPVGVGTGLGLFVSHGIVTALAGEIRAESEPGRGTTIRVVLPAAPADASAKKTARADAPATPSRRARILIVDDDGRVAQSIRLVLAMHDATVVDSARRALALLEAGERFDLVLCDLMMTDMTGMDLYDAIVERAPEVIPRMVFMTGGAFTAAASDFLARVPNERLEKPFSPTVLRELVERYLGEQ